MRKSLNVLNLFSGCGGFALGAVKAGFDIIAALDIDEKLSSSFKYNFPDAELILADITEISSRDLSDSVDDEIHGVIGGPPCQGFSLIGRRMSDDPRNLLIYDFYRFVDELKPAFFVMENVVGLVAKGTSNILREALARVSSEYHIFGPQKWSVSEFGGATTRSRVFVIGMCKRRTNEFRQEEMDTEKVHSNTVKHAIGDLESAVYIGVDDRFDVWRVKDRRRSSEYSKALQSQEGFFTSHVVTQHTTSVKKRFAKLKEGEVDSVGRYPRLSWNGLCPTLRSGTGVERGSYMALRPIHPSLDRVITVREAARLQGFPDSHRFHPTIWHSMRMIGNSVSPIMSRAILNVIMKKVQT